MSEVYSIGRLYEVQKINNMHLYDQCVDRVTGS